MAKITAIARDASSGIKTLLVESKRDQNINVM